MDLTALNRTPIGAAARGVGRIAFGAATAITTVGAMVFSGRGLAGFRVFLNRTKIDYGAALNDPFQNSIVVAVVGWIARNFPEAPVQVTRGSGSVSERIPPEIAGPGAMLRLLERPNRYFSGVLMWMAAIVDLYCTGNAYLVKVRNRSGRVAELWWIPKRYMRPDWPVDGSKFISRYIYSVDGREFEIAVEDVVHLRDGIDPLNPRLGLSKLASLFREIYTDDEAANFTAQLLTNLGVPGVVIAPANTTNGAVRTDPEAVKTAFMEKFGGDKRGEPLVLSAPTEVKVLSFSPQQMNLKELRRIPEERISAVLGVSAIVAGLGAGLDRSTFTNFGEARKAAYEESVIPMQRLIAAELEVQLLPEFASADQIEREMLDVGFDLRNVRALQEAADAVWKRHESAASKGLLKRSSFKRAIGEPVEAEDDVYVMPNNFVLVPAGGTPPPGGARTATVTRVAEEAPRQLTAVQPPLLAGPAAVHCAGCGKMLAQVKREVSAGAVEVKCPRCGAVNDVAA